MKRVTSWFAWAWVTQARLATVAARASVKARMVNFMVDDSERVWRMSANFVTRSVGEDLLLILQV